MDPHAAHQMSLLDQMGIVPAIVGVQIVGFVLLYLLLKRFLWKPVASFLDERRRDIEHTFDDIETRRAEMEQLKAEYEQRLNNIEAEARAQTQAAVKESQSLRDQILAEAQKHKERLLSEARQTIEHEKEQMLAEMRIRVTDLTLKATGMLLDRRMDADQDRELVAQYIDQVARN